MKIKMMKDLRMRVINYVCISIIIAATIGFPDVKKIISLSSASGTNKDKKNIVDLTTDSEKGNQENLSFSKRNLTINFEGRKMDIHSPIYEESNRFYLPLDEIVRNMNGQLSVNDSIVKIKIDKQTVYIDKLSGQFSRNGMKSNLRKGFRIIDDTAYMSLYDVVKMFYLKTDWNFDTNTISLFWNNSYTKPTVREDKRIPKKNAFIRLEDMFPGFKYSTEQDLEKLRCIGDLLYANNVPFHVAWVQRYIDHEKGIDNDLAEAYSIYNADFIFTLDYFIDRNGIIGLHGYTHQCGNEPSHEGTEFSETAHSSEKETRERVEKAISNAQKLDIPVGFFETPHYSGTKLQFSIIEEYFNFIYQPKIPQMKDAVVQKKVGNRVIRYVPTPLSYIRGKEDAKNIKVRIQALQPDALTSFYFHPFLEFDSIELIKDETGCPEYKYDDDSPLHNLIKTFNECGYRFTNITNIN